MIEINNYLIKIHQDLLFQVDSLCIQKGSVYFLLGKNGCGKSTFLKSFLLPSKANNSFVIDGLPQVAYTSKELAQKIAYVPSKLIANDYTSVQDFLLMGRYPYGKPFSGSSEADLQLVEENLDLLEIRHLKNKSLSELSDGQQQLVSIGRALVQEVDYLLLDEPTAFLDYSNKCKILNLATLLSHTKNIGIIVVTHDVEFVFKQQQDIYYIDTCSKKLHQLPFSSQKTFDEVIALIYEN